MRRGAPAATLAAALALLGNAGPPLRSQQPVMVGGHEDLDACLTVSAVTGLNPRGDNFLSLRSRPAASAPEMMRLRSGQQVWVCQETRDGWTGIVFGAPGDALDCDVGTPQPLRQAYKGRCHSGWVASRFLVVLAG